MKHLLFWLIAALVELFAQPVQAQRYLATLWDDSAKTAEVPELVANAFRRKFPGAVVGNWEVCCPIDLPNDSAEKQVYEVIFSQAGNQATARFTGTGQLEEFTREMAILSLSRRVRRAAHRVCASCAIARARFGTNEVGSFQVYYLDLHLANEQYGDPIRVRPNGKVLSEPKFR